MTAPTHTARGSGPAGIKLKDGFSSVLRIAAAPTVGLWTKGLKPPGLDGGDAIPQTTMENTLWRTFAPRALITLTEASAKAAYDPAVYTSLLTILNKAGSMTYWFSDGSYLDFYGFLKSFQPGELVEGTQPEADIIWVATNTDSAGLEVAPVLYSAAGT